MANTNLEDFVKVANPRDKQKPQVAKVLLPQCGQRAERVTRSKSRDAMI
jgi:hypothetical protein